MKVVRKELNELKALVQRTLKGMSNDIYLEAALRHIDTIDNIIGYEDDESMLPDDFTLKLCPFCASRAEIGHTFCRNRRHNFMTDGERISNVMEWCIRCGGCGKAESTSTTLHGAVHCWNHRPEC